MTVTVANSDRPQSLPALTSLRFFLACWVMLLHGADYLESWLGTGPSWEMNFLRTGYQGVNVFFVLSGFVLAGDTSAQAWIRTLLQDELAAQSYGRLLLLPGAKPPVAVQSRGKPVCTCFNVSDMAIDEHLALLSRGGGGGGHLGTDEERLASLQATLKCGTNCGSCVPELKRRVRSAHDIPPSPQEPSRAVIPLRQVA
jgi:bacterioferritin-associated ferredoxin